MAVLKACGLGNFGANCGTSPAATGISKENAESIGDQLKKTAGSVRTGCDNNIERMRHRGLRRIEFQR